jgi:DNA repair exonuclease SbcCD ATPase subunit
MQSDPLRPEHRLRLEAVSKTATELQTLRRRLQQDLDTRSKEVEVLTVRLDTLTKVGELFRALMDRLVMDHVRSIEGVVTEGLRSIFWDMDLTFEAEVSQRYNKIAIDFFIRQDDQKMSIRANPLDAFGGGPTSIASLILKVLAMRRLNKWPLLVLDETLAAVSNEYIELTSQFLRELASKTGISILLITHKPAFLDHANIGYQASPAITEDGSRVLHLQREKTQ